MVLLETKDVWYSVCEYGYGKDWGKKEAMVACRQLQYEGGWPVDVDRMATEYSNQSFVDFDCSWRKYKDKRRRGWYLLPHREVWRYESIHRIFMYMANAQNEISSATSNTDVIDILVNFTKFGTLN